MNQRKLWDLLSRLTPVLAVLLALLVGAVMLALLGTNPWEAYRALFIGAFGSTNALADTVVKATPLLFVGLGICIAFRGGVLNIGGEGQFVTGAIAATAVALAVPTWPGWLIIAVSLCWDAGRGDMGRDRRFLEGPPQRE
jgi:simple sugar transport system permease protein